MPKRKICGSIGSLRQLLSHKAYKGIADRIEAVILRKSRHSYSEIGHSLGRSKKWALKWCHRYKELGIDGLFDTPRAGRPTHLVKEKEASFIKRIQGGPQEKDGISVFTAGSINDILKNEYQATYSQKSVYSILHRLDFSRIRPRPQHEKYDHAKVMHWKTNTLLDFYEMVAKKNLNKEIEFWFQDETRFGNKTPISSIWAEKGSAPRIKKQNGYKNAYIFGAVNPMSGNSSGLVFSNIDSDIMNVHLFHIGQVVPSNSHAILILDQAGFHSKSSSLRPPENISLLDLPPYSPELNPMETVWLWIKSRYLKNRIIKTDEDLIRLGCDLWNKLTPEVIQSLTKVSYLPVPNF